MSVAAIDIGTNTVRLLVADVTSEGVRHLARALEITRLGQGVDAGRRLAPEAADRTLEAVGRLARRAREAGAEAVRVAGTSALRDAADRDAFASAVRERTGADLEILDGPDEGTLAFLGATLGRRGGPFLVCDIGGGSTELVRGRRNVEAVWSADVGSVRLRERFLTADPPTRGEVEAARTVVDAALREAGTHLCLAGDETLVGVAGTVTTLAALALGLDRYDPDRVHDTVLSAGDVSTWCERLLRMPVAEIRALPTMEAGRADVIASGALILREVMTMWGFGEVAVSERDILDGLVWDRWGRRSDRR